MLEKKREKMQATRLVMLGTMLVVLPGCRFLMGDNGPFRDRQGDYLVAPTAPVMSIPSNLDSYTLDELYVIPPPPPSDQYFVRTPPPQPLDTNIREGVVVQRFGDRRWIVIGAEPAQVWPRLRDYWSAEQIPLTREDPVNAVTETAWLGTDGDTRNKYQVRVEPGLHSGNSEVYVLQVSDDYISDPDAPIDWPTNSANLELEHAMLDRISLYLADRTDLYRASSVSLLAGSIAAEGKANIQPGPNGNTLALRIDFDRAWSQINQALTNAGIAVSSSDRDAGTFTVSFAGISDEDDEGPGFFGRLFGRGNDEVTELPEFVLHLQDEGQSIVVEAEQVTPANVANAELRNELIRAVHNNLI